MEYIGANWVCLMVYWLSAMLTASKFVNPMDGRVVLVYADLRGTVPMTIGRMMWKLELNMLHCISMVHCTHALLCVMFREATHI